MTDGCFQGVWIHPLFCGRKIDSTSKQVNFCVTFNIWLSHKWSHECLRCTASKPTVHIKGQISLLYLTWFSRWMWMERPTQRRERWLDKHSVCHYHQITEQQFGFLPLRVTTRHFLLWLMLSLFIAAHFLSLSQINGLLLAVKQDQLKAVRLTRAILTVIQLYFTYITLIECPSKNDTNKTQIRSYLFVNSKKTFAASKLFGPFLKVHQNSPQAGRRIQ